MHKLASALTQTSCTLGQFVLNVLCKVLHATLEFQTLHKGCTNVVREYYYDGRTITNCRTSVAKTTQDEFESLTEPRRMLLNEYVTACGHSLLIDQHTCGAHYQNSGCGAYFFCFLRRRKLKLETVHQGPSHAALVKGKENIQDNTCVKQTPCKQK